VKDFLFKPKPKEKASGDPPELWSGPEKKKGSEKKKKTDRWTFSKTLEGHTKAVDEICICPYDPYIIGTASRDGSARLWNLDGTSSAMFSGHKEKGGSVNSIRIHGNGTSRLVFTAGTDGTCQMFKIPAFMMHSKSPKESILKRRESKGDSPSMSPDISGEDKKKKKSKIFHRSYYFLFFF
jgi:WD40 repeat protein